MQLPRGITGFRHVNDSPLPVCDLKAFRGLCHTAARSCDGRVLSVESQTASTTANYARVVVELPTGAVAILLNLHHPIVAFAAPVDDAVELQFVDAPQLRDQFGASGVYTVLTAAEARAPVTAESCQWLSRAELDQVRYWRPGSIGEVVFNYWD